MRTSWDRRGLIAVLTGLKTRVNNGFRLEALPSGALHSGGPMRIPARPTMADVAAAAGVGVGTVSRVVNGGVNVRASTRRHVEAVIERLGYRPSHLAAAL